MAKHRPFQPLNSMRIHSIILSMILLCSWHTDFSSGQVESVPIDSGHAAMMTDGLRIFKSDVRTIFSGRCIKCHNQKKTEGGLDLSTRVSLLTGGDSGSVVEIGKPDESYLIQLIMHDEEPVMPADGARLDDRQIGLIARWIELGAPYDKPLTDLSNSDPRAWINRRIDQSAQEFWSFKPLQNTQVPPLASDHWSRNDVDRLIWRRLEQAKITPNSEADRRTLVRRAYFDLIGLPPSPEQVAAFVEDDDPHAFENLIDQLLESPHFGERWGRHWLDVARFAESFGFEQDYDRPYAYTYRDFVIQAFNEDMPFDQFVQWQLAGDEIAPHEPQALMATGFLGAGVFPTQLTEKEFESARYDELDDMVSTAGTGLLGLTIGCARCHDHKFDPIPMRDYYQLVAVFGNTIRSNVEIEINAESTKQKLADWQIAGQKISDELTTYENGELREKFQSYVRSIVQSTEIEDRSSAAGDTGLKAAETSNWIALPPVSAEAAHGTQLNVDGDARIHASGSNPHSETFTIALETGLTDLRSIRLEAFPDPSLKQNGPGRAGNGNFALGKLTITAEPLHDSTTTDQATSTVEVALQRPRATFQQNDKQLSIEAALDDDPKTGWAIDPRFGQRHTAIFDFVKPLGFPNGTRLIVKMEFGVNNQHVIGVSRFSVTSADSPLSTDAETVSAFDAEVQKAKNSQSRLESKSIRRILFHGFKQRDVKWRQLVKRLRDHESRKPERKTMMAMICSEGVKPIPHHGDDRGFPHFYPQTYFLNRGDASQKLAVAGPGFLQALTPLSFVPATETAAGVVEAAPENDEGSLSGNDSGGIIGPQWDLSRWQVSRPSGAKTSFRRRAFANWITDTQSGAGHLLARVIVNRLWQHHFGQGLVSTPNDFGFQGDRPSHPQLLDFLAQSLIDHHWKLKPLHRLMMTSATYQQSSSWDPQKFSIDPNNRLGWRYTPRRLEAEIIRDSMLACGGQLDPTPRGPGTLDVSMRRRSIYFTIKRSRLIPFLQIFDAPEPLVSVGNRPATTVAPQALICINNQQVRQWTVGFSTDLQSRANGSREQIELGYLRALSRVPSNNELQDTLAFFQAQQRSYVADNRTRAEAHTLALADVCQVLMSLNEFVYVD